MTLPLLLSIILYLALGFVFGFLYRAILKKVAKKKVRTVTHNIARPGRLLRATLGVILLVWAAFTGWGALALFASGFCFFEAIFSWCGFFAAIGKNSCPIE